MRKRCYVTEAYNEEKKLREASLVVPVKLLHLQCPCVSTYFAKKILFVSSIGYACKAIAPAMSFRRYVCREDIFFVSSNAYAFKAIAPTMS